MPSIRDCYVPDPYHLLSAPDLSVHAAARHALLSAVRERQADVRRSRPAGPASRLRALVAKLA